MKKISAVEFIESGCLAYGGNDFLSSLILRKKNKILIYF